MERPNLVRDRFRAELERWLTPALLYHGFTGEDDPYVLARFEGLDTGMQELLLNRAEREWPQRLESIAAERKAKAKESKAVVRSFVQKSLVGANAEPHR